MMLTLFDLEVLISTVIIISCLLTEQWIKNRSYHFHTSDIKGSVVLKVNVTQCELF